jgi:hypothetical protein
MTYAALTQSGSALLPTRQAWRTAAGLIIIGAAVYAVMPTLPLYSDNQNTKFLYGLAKAGVGRLKDDWLIGQGSSLPIFDALVYLTQTILGGWFFYVWHFFAVTTYTAAMYGIARVVGVTQPERFGPDGRWFLVLFGAWLTALSTTHATLKAFWGVAIQYLNGTVFQPQSFGILALLALLLFRLRETGWAVVLIIASAWLHPPYAIAGLMILLGMTVARWRFGPGEVNLSVPVLAGGIIGCLGAAGFTYSLLQPTDPAIAAEAVRIITELRIPEHSLPGVWFDADAVIKLVVFCFVLWIARHDPLAWVLMVVGAGVAVSTLWVYVAHDLELALAAPWRASAIVVPAGVAILIGRALQAFASWTEGHPRRRRAALAVTAAALCISVGLGVFNKLRFFNELQKPLYFAFIRESAQDGDVYLTPVDDMDFRLATGQPQYATWKTHPHRGDAVLEWYRRVGRARAVTEATQPSCSALDDLAREGVTHLVRQQPNGDLHCPGWSVVYEDGDYTVSRHRAAGG